MVCYAVKANGNPHLLKLLATFGLGADIVSDGELRQALEAGIPASKIVFSGVGKTPTELAHAVQMGVHQLNVESAEELRALDKVAQKQGKVADVALRVNPDVDAATHEKITTGTLENKFGIPWAYVPDLLFEAGNMAGVRVVGLAVHIGSQITSLRPYAQAYQRLAQMVEELAKDGYPLTRLDIGGGLGIRYDNEELPTLEAYRDLVQQTLGHLNVKLIVEPGRSLVGNSGMLVTKVLYTKQNPTKQFAIIDAGMTELLRPAMYGAVHRILPVRKSTASLQPYDVVGPVCESSDVFARNLPLPPLAADALLAIADVGAYGAVMGSSYNIRPPAAEVLVTGNKFAVIRKRPSYDEMNAWYSAPQWSTVV
jgi:diaminopimelate decarboxylase